MARSAMTFEKRRRELEKIQKKEAKRLKKEAKKNGDYTPLPEIYVAEAETGPDETAPRG